MSSIFTAASSGNLAAVQGFIASGADLDAGGDKGWTALYLASRGDHLEVVNALLAAGADKNKANNNGTTPLIIAIQEGDKWVVNALLAAGADKNKANNNGSTPLIIASQKGGLEIVNALLAAGADENKANNNGATPLSIASSRGYIPIVIALLEAGAKLTIPAFQGISVWERARTGAFTPQINEIILEYGYISNEPLTNANIAEINAAKAAGVPWRRERKTNGEGMRRYRKTRTLRKKKRSTRRVVN